jgi:hypothetical protein
VHRVDLYAGALGSVHRCGADDRRNAPLAQGLHLEQQIVEGEDEGVTSIIITITITVTQPLSLTHPFQTLYS